MFPLQGNRVMHNMQHWQLYYPDMQRGERVCHVGFCPSTSVHTEIHKQVSWMASAPSNQGRSLLTRPNTYGNGEKCSQPGFLSADCYTSLCHTNVFHHIIIQGAMFLREYLHWEEKKKKKHLMGKQRARLALSALYKETLHSANGTHYRWGSETLGRRRPPERSSLLSYSWFQLCHCEISNFSRATEHILIKVR